MTATTSGSAEVDPKDVAGMYLVMPTGQLYATRHAAVGRAAVVARYWSDLLQPSVRYVAPEDTALQESVAALLNRGVVSIPRPFSVPTKRVVTDE